MNIESLRGACISLSIMNLIMTLPVLYLVSYHVWLKYHHLSTYEHILQMRQRKRQTERIDTMDDGQEDYSEYHET